MANTTIKISQLPSIGTNVTSNTLMPVVDTSGTLLTEKASLGNIANFILTEAGNLLPEAFLSTYSQTVINAAQPNITSVGTLTNLSVSGNVTLPYLETIIIPGGVNGDFLQTDGLGNLVWSAAPGAGSGSPGGSNQQIQYNLNGIFAGDPLFKYNSVTKTLYANTIESTGNITANFFIGNGSQLTGLSILPEASGPNGAVQFNEDGILAGDSNFTYDSANSILTIPNVDGNITYANYAYHVDVEPTVNNFSYHIVMVQNPGDNHLLVDDDDHLQYNPADGTLTAVRVDASYFVGNLNFAHGYEAANVVGLGNIASINLNGNSDQVLAGNGAWVSQGAGGGNTFTSITMTDSPAGAANIIQYGLGNLVAWNDGGWTIGEWNGTQYGTEGMRINPGIEGSSDIILPSDSNAATIPVQINNYAGNVQIQTGNGVSYYNWLFDNTGNLKFSGNGIISNPTNSSLDPLLPNVSTMVLQPDSNYYQSLVIDPTSPGHIHLRAPSYSSNIDEPTANLFLGGELSSFEVPYSSNGAPNVYVHSNAQTWTFGTDSNLTLPTGAKIGTYGMGWTGIVANGQPISIVSQSSNISYLGQPTTGIETYGADTDGFTRIFAGNVVTGNTYNFDFYSDGNLNLPGSIDATGELHLGGDASLSGNVTIYKDLQVNGNINFTGNVTQISGNSGQFFGDANGIGALYAGIPVGFSVVYNPVIQASASSNDYVQINFQNINNGTQNSADYVITADDGSDTQGFIDMGIAGSSWDGTQTNSLGTALNGRDGYLYVQGGLGGGNLVLGTATTGTEVKFVVGGPNTGNIVANITSSGLYATHLKGEGGNISNIQGINVSGAVAFATTANSVAGANVSGQVSYAAVANSVAAANVSGLGNLALINKDGNASNILYGNGVFASAPVTYGNSNVATFLASYGSNTITTTGNITAGNFLVGANTIGNVAFLNKDGNASNILYGNGVFASAPTVGTSIANGTSNVAIGTSGGNVVTTVGSATILTVYSGGIKVAGGGVLQSPGGASAITLNNNGANIPTANITTALNVTGNANVTGNISATGNVTGNYVKGDGSQLTNVTVNVAGNIVGTSSNVTLVAGSYTYTFDNVGELTLPTVGGDEGGQINFGVPATNTTLQSKVTVDVYQNKIRFFEGSANAKGVFMDLSDSPTGVGGEISYKNSGYVNAGTFVTLDNIKATLTSSGNRGLSLATTTGSITATLAGTYATSGGTGGSSSNGTISVTTSASTSHFNWNFAGQGDMSTYVLNDTTNSRVYRITLIIGGGYSNNFISIERL